MSVLLRSGDVKDYTALGQDGQAVYSVANQLRDAIRLKRGRMMADYLAVPQRNDIGSAIDWYIPFDAKGSSGEYRIIPWSSATIEEKNDALKELDIFKANMLDLGRDLVNSAKGDQLLFSRLLFTPDSSANEQLKAIRFPNKEHVYLVDGRPVITFWGFIEKNQTPYDDPFFTLRPEKNVQPLTSTETTASTVSEGAEIQEKRKHVCCRWWILLPLFLLLLFLLWWFLSPFLSKTFGVQLPTFENIMPTKEIVEPQKEELVTPRLVDGRWVDSSGIEITDPAVLANLNGSGNVSQVPTNSQGVVQESQKPEVLADKALDNAQNVANAEPAAEITPSVNEEKDAATSNSNPLAESDKAPDASSSAEANKAPDVSSSAEANKAPDASSSAEANKAPDANTLPESANTPASNAVEASKNSTSTSDSGKNLVIDPNMIAEGNTDFLNGQWNAGAGIQDKSTGKPLKLSYQFNNGKGQVTLKRGDGVSCTANVNAAIQGGGLAINNAGTATCSDGSSYQLPNVSCKPTLSGQADCKGNYGGGDAFPMSMKSI